MEIYYDRFNYEFITKKDEFAAPERYYKILPLALINDTFIETWYVSSNNKNLKFRETLYTDISYTSADKDNNRVDYIRNKIAEEHGVKLVYMTEYRIPATDYNKIYNHLLKQGE